MSPEEFRELRKLVQIEARRNAARAAGCVGKHRFENRDAALGAIRRDKPYLEPYRCPFCEKWHLGAKFFPREPRPRPAELS